MLLLRRWLRRLALTLLCLVLLAVAVVVGAPWLTLPSKQGEPQIGGLRAPVSITIDDYGVPRIAAQDEHDGTMALGWLHARDRMFQMELMRRGAAGRLSEIAGPSTLRLDRFSRTLGLERRAEADFATLPPDTRNLLQAYADGVNAYIRARGRFVAPEFLLLGAPEPWKPSDSLLWGKVMGLWLSGSWRADLERAGLARLLPPDRLAEIWPRDETPGRPDQVAGNAVPAAAQHAEALPFDIAGAARLLAATPSWPSDAPLPPTASNSWALMPSRSSSGGALLANDPHLGFQAPIIWYLARIDLPGGRFLAGATSPGVPFMVIGRNQNLAWGFTTTSSDVQDVFIERLSGDQYDTPDGPQPFVTRQERIMVRGQPDDVITVRETRHGPVISDLGEAAPPGHVLAVAMANLAPNDTAAAGLHGVNRARSVAEAKEAARLITSPPQNLMMADAEGHVAMVLTGRTPIRLQGDGTMPVAGWDGAHDWVGWVAFDEMPHATDPAGGALANGNNRVEPQDSRVFLGRDWFGDWRFRRIHERLAEQEKHNAAGMAAIQNDIRSLFAADIMPALRALPAQEGAMGEALSLLTHWDGTMSADRPEPLIFNAWWREAALAILEKGGVPRGLTYGRPEFLRFALSPAGRHWCGEGERACDPLLLDALRVSLQRLMAQLGGSPRDWQWGTLHQARFEHPLLRAVPVLNRLIRMEAPTPGDDQTVSRGGMRGGDGADAYIHNQGAGLRMVADLSTPDGVWAVIATGQSGNPVSSHWDDAFPLWLGGKVMQLGPTSGLVTGSFRLRP